MPPRRRPYSRKRAGRYTRPSYTRAVRTVRARRAPVRRTGQRRGATTSCVCPSGLTPAVKFALAQIDPFDVKSDGAKIPDSNTQPSIPTTDIEINNITTTAVASDLSALAFRPQYTWGLIPGTPGATVGWGAAFVTNALNRTKRTAYVAAVELTRPVAHAVRISSPVAPLNASGFIHIGIVTEGYFGVATWQNPTNIAQMTGLPFYRRVTLASLTQSPITVINKWIDDTGFRYSAANADFTNGSGSSFTSDYSWGTIVIMTEGCPISTVVVSCEHLLMSEGIPNKDGPITGSPAARSEPGVVAATSNMQANTEATHTESEQESMMAKAGNSLLKGAKEQGQQVFDSIAPGICEAIGAAGVQYLANNISPVGIPGVNVARLTN